MKSIFIKLHIFNIKYSGTNAYTMEDNTGYTLVTAGIYYFNSSNYVYILYIVELYKYIYINILLYRC